MNDLLLGFLFLFWCDLKKNLQSILTIGVVPISDPPVDLCGATMEKKAEISLTEMSNLLSSQYPFWLVKKWLG